METQSQSDERARGTGETGGASSQSGAKPNGQELMDELNRLGGKFVEVVEVAWNSDQRRRIEDDLRKGLQSLAVSLEDGLRHLGESKQTQEFVDTAEEVAESVTAKVRSSKIANELAAALAVGLRSLSERMDRLAKDMQAKSGGQGAPGAGDKPDETQDIPIDRG
jgi:hypothetical protein